MIDVSTLNQLDEPGNGTGGTGQALGMTAGMTPRAATDRDTLKMSANQTRTLHALLSQEPHESMASVAKRASVSRSAIYRYLKDEVFANEYRRLTLLEVKGQYAPLMRAIVRGAQERGPGQAALARIILEKIGDAVIDRTENVNINHGGINLDDAAIPIHVKRHVCAIFAALEGKGPLPECCQPHTLLVPSRQAWEPAPEPPKPVTPLDEVELKPAPEDTRTPDV